MIFLSTLSSIEYLQFASASRQQSGLYVAVTHNEIDENIATVKKRAYLFHWIVHTVLLVCFNELQSLCAKNGSDRFSFNDQSHCNKTCKVFDCKVIETRPQVSCIICMLLLRVESFQQTIIAVEEVF